MTLNEAMEVFTKYLKTGRVPNPVDLQDAAEIANEAISLQIQTESQCGEDNMEYIGVKESPLKTFPRVNEFETGASYRH